MSMFRSGNPVLGEKAFEVDEAVDTSNVMTVQGAVTKTIIAIAITVAAAGWVWTQFYAHHDVNEIVPYLVGGSFAGFLVAIFTCFVKRAAPFTTPVYAALEGFALGGISVLYD